MTRRIMVANPVIRTQTNWQAVFAAVLCGISVAMNVGKVPIAMSQLRTEFGLSLVTAGWVSSMVNALGMLSGTLFGLLGDHFGALRTCFVGLAISILGGVLGLIASDDVILLISRFIEGAGVMTVSVSAPALLSSASTPADRRFALSIWGAYFPIGVGLAMLIAPVVIPAMGWRGLWWLTMATLIVSFLGIYLVKDAYRLPATTTVESHPLVIAREALVQPAPWLLAFAMFSWTIQFYALVVWFPTFLKEQRNYSALSISLLSCLVVFANAPGNLLGGGLMQRNFQRGKLIAGASLVTGLCGVGVFLDQLPDLMRYVLCVALSFVGGIIPAVVFSASASLAKTPKQIGTLQGLFMQISNLGSFISPPLIALVVASSGLWRDALVVTSAAALLGITLGLTLLRLNRTVKSPSTYN